MKRLLDIRTFIEAMRWIYSTSHEVLQEQINSKRRLVFAIMRRARDTGAVEHELMWRNLAKGHLLQIQQMEAKRMKYIAYGTAGTLIGSLVLLLTVLMVVLG